MRTGSCHIEAGQLRSHPQTADLASQPVPTARIPWWPAACSMVWPTSPAAVACSRWVS
jgi:hypothetical protein